MRISKSEVVPYESGSCSSQVPDTQARKPGIAPSPNHQLQPQERERARSSLLNAIALIASCFKAINFDMFYFLSLLLCSNK
jgi:hypothetical protein